MFRISMGDVCLPHVEQGAEDILFGVFCLGFGDVVVVGIKRLDR